MKNILKNNFNHIFKQAIHVMNVNHHLIMTVTYINVKISVIYGIMILIFFKVIILEIY